MTIKLPEKYSLAEFVLWSVSTAASMKPLSEAHESNCKFLADNLHGTSANNPGVARLAYDEKAIAAVAATDFITTKEILSNIDALVLPFDRCWIEGPAFMPDMKLITWSKPLRYGFLIQRAAQGNIEVKFGAEMLLSQIVSETAPPTMSYAEASAIFKRRQPIADDKILITDGYTHTISPSKIDLDERILEESHDASRVTAHIDVAHHHNEFIIRLLMLLSSPRIPNNLSEIKNAHNPEAEKERFLGNKRRERTGQYALAPTTPIRIDLGEDIYAALKDKSIKKVRELLGWTRVRDHKRVYRNADGTPRLIIDIHSYDRRIGANVDRRNVVRELTASGPVAPERIGLALTTDPKELFQIKKLDKDLK